MNKRNNDTNGNCGTATNVHPLTPSESKEGPLLPDDAFASSIEDAFLKSLPQKEDEAMKARVWARLQKSIFKELN